MELGKAVLEEAAEEPYRPAFHFTPAQGWMNDPNGLVYNEETKEYLMYFQYCPDVEEKQGEKYWRLAVSKDLIHWTEEQNAIAPDHLGAVWSGSCVIDRDNTSGFFDEHTPPSARIVAFYTSAFGDTTSGTQKQCVAYSVDNGRSFIKYEGNPVICGKIDGEAAFENRDPKVFWFADDAYPKGGIWIMVIAGMRATLFVSENLREWEFASFMYEYEQNFGTAGKLIESECPDLFPIALDGNTDHIKWVYCGAGRLYIVGNLVKKGPRQFEFVAETPIIEPMHGSEDMYAAQTFYNIPDGRRVAVYWLIEKTAASLNKAWDGAQSLPVELRLVTEGNEMRLKSSFIKEAELLRENTLISAMNSDLAAIQTLLGNIDEAIFEIECEIAVPHGGEFGFELFDGDSCRTVITYSAAEQRVSVDRSNSGLLANELRSAYVPLASNVLTLKMLFDTSIIEIAVNDGDVILSTYIYPIQAVNTLMNTENTRKIALLYTNESFHANQFHLYSLKSIHRGVSTRAKRLK